MAIKISADDYKKKFGVTPMAPTPEKGPSFLQKAGQDIGNATKGGLNYAKQGFSEAANAKNPGQLFEGIGKIGSGAAGAISAPLAPVINPTIGAGINYAADKISNSPQVQKFANTKTGQTIARGAENVANYANIAGLAAGGLEAPKIDAAIARTGEVAGKATGNVLSKTGGALKTLGEKAYEITVPPTESTARAMLAYDAKQPTLLQRIKGVVGEGTKPITEANTAARMGLQGTEYGIGVGAKKAATQLWDTTIAPKLQTVKGAVNMKSFFDEVGKELQKTPELSRRSDVRAALESLREDYQNVGKNIDLTTLQGYKSGWAKQIPEAAYKGKPIGSALKEVKSIAADKARQIIYKYVGPEGQQAYIDYGNLQSIIEAGQKSITGDLAKKSLTRDIWQGIMDKAITPIATTVGKVLYKTGEGLEFIGPKGAQKVGDIIGNPKIGLSFEDVSQKSKLNMSTGNLISHEGAPDLARIEQYKQMIQSGQPIEPLKIMAEKNGYGIEDGKHRFEAYKQLGHGSVPVEILPPKVKINNYQNKPQYTKGAAGRFTGSSVKK